MFDPEEFLKRPPQEILDTLKALSVTRDELVVLARHLEIEPKTSSTKPEIRQLILSVLVTKNIVGEESDEKTEEKEDTETSTMMVKTRKYDQEFELEKLKLQMELEKMRLETQRQEKESERQEKERERERQEKERERERERQERERERESARQIQEREKERQFELEKLKLQQLNHPIGQSFDVIKKLATNLNWPKDHWTILLQKAFVGKAREIFAQLSVEQSQKYEYVKDVVLRGYQLNPEAYRQKFRNCQRDISQTFVEFARVKEQLFDRWCHSKKVNKDFEKLRQVILIEEFKRRIPFHMKTFIDEKQVENLQQAADLADEYFLTHGNFNQQRNQSSDKQYTANPSSGSDSFQ